MAHCEHQRVRSTCSACSPEPVFRQYAYKAQKRGLSFTITLEEFEKLVAMPCHYCGAYDVMGLDRVDSRLSYYTENVVPCCKKCNFMKARLSSFDFVQQSIRIAKHEEKQKLTPPQQAVAA